MSWWLRLGAWMTLRCQLQVIHLCCHLSHKFQLFVQFSMKFFFVLKQFFFVGWGGVCASDRQPPNVSPGSGRNNFSRKSPKMVQVLLRGRVNKAPTPPTLKCFICGPEEMDKVLFHLSVILLGLDYFLAFFSEFLGDFWTNFLGGSFGGVFISKFGIKSTEGRTCTKFGVQGKWTVLNLVVGVSFGYSKRKASKRPVFHPTNGSRL